MSDLESTIDNDRNEANIERWRNPEMSRRDIALERGYDPADDAWVPSETVCRVGDCGIDGCLVDVLFATIGRQRASEQDAEWHAGGDVA